MSFPARTAPAAASSSVRQMRMPQRSRPTLSQSVTTNPRKPHCSRSTSVSSQRLSVQGTPSIAW